MATRFKSSDLQEMIRKIVRSEMKEVVAATINEVLSERYLKGLAESAVAARPRGVNNLHIQGDEPDDEDDNVPHTLANTILGVGQENPVFKKVPKDDGVRQFKEGVDRNEILNLFFEGTKPLQRQEEKAEEGIPLDMDNPAIAEAASKWSDLVKQADQLSETRKPIQAPKDPAAEEARIKRMREQLDAKVVG
jgi:hypothetical protein